MAFIFHFHNNLVAISANLQSARVKQRRCMWAYIIVKVFVCVCFAAHTGCGLQASGLPKRKECALPCYTYNGIGVVGGSSICCLAAVLLHVRCLPLRACQREIYICFFFRCCFLCFWRSSWKDNTFLASIHVTVFRKHVCVYIWVYMCVCCFLLLDQAIAATRHDRGCKGLTNIWG